MSLYLGSNKVKINMNNGDILCLNIPTPTHTFSGIELLSFDNYVLKSSDNYYLMSKEGKTNG